MAFSQISFPSLSVSFIIAQAITPEMASGVVEGDFSADESDTSGSSSDDDTQFNEEDQKKLHEELKDVPKCIKWVCAGPTGVGKSTLLNGLTGGKDFSDEDVVRVPRFKVGHSLKQGTITVIQKTFRKNGIRITVFDTPGLEGCDGTDDSYLKEIEEKCNDYDLFLLLHQKY